MNNDNGEPVGYVSIKDYVQSPAFEYVQMSGGEKEMLRDIYQRFDDVTRDMSYLLESHAQAVARIANLEYRTAETALEHRAEIDRLGWYNIAIIIFLVVETFALLYIGATGLAGMGLL